MTSDWTMSQEREFMEHMVGQRFNFLVLIYSVIVAGALNSNQQSHMQIILGVGFVITFLVSYTVFRVYRKHDILCSTLFRMRGAKAKAKNGWSA